MKFIVMINHEVDLGAALNGVAHITLGLGHLLDGPPDVNIYFGTTQQVRELRTRTVTLADEGTRVAYSDFPHTMHGGDTDKQLELGKQTPEADMEYYGVCVVAERINPDMVVFLNSCLKLKGYEQFTASTQKPTKLLPPVTSKANNEITNKKIVMLINNKLPLAQTINGVILACLKVGADAAYDDLRLLDVMDRDGNAHPNISYHPFPILRPDNAEKHGAIVKTLAQRKMVFNCQRNAKAEILATVIFGNQPEVEDAVPKNVTRLYTLSFKKEKELEPASTPLENKSENKRASTEECKSDSLSPLSAMSVFSPRSDAEFADLQPEALMEKLPTNQESYYAFDSNLAGLRKEIGTDIGRIKKFVQNKPQAEECIKRLIDSVFLHAAGNGQIECVKFLKTTYHKYLDDESISKAFTFAEALGEKAGAESDILRVIDYLKGYLPTVSVCPQ